MTNNSLFNGGENVPKGDEGERACIDWLRFLYPKGKIEDLRANAFYQAKEIDFRVWHDGTVETFEAKYDRHIAAKGNFVFELCRIHHTSKTHCVYRSWSVFTEADYVTAWCLPARKLYQIKADDLRTGMQRYVSEFQERINLQPKASDKLRTTINIYVPMRYVPHIAYHWTGGIWAQISPLESAS